MSTHNIGFYEDLTKIIFELSSNIIKYAPYFFCCFSILQDEQSLRAKTPLSLRPEAPSCIYSNTPIQWLTKRRLLK